MKKKVTNKAYGPKKQNNTLNLLKGLACIAVVFIHVQFPGIFGQLVTALARSGVALFFIISGYFLYRPNREDIIKALPRKIIRLAKLTLIAFIVYFLWESFVRFIGGGFDKVLEWYTQDLFTLKSLVQFIAISYDPVVGHLWFLIALLESYILAMLLLRFKIVIHWIIVLVILEIHIILMSFSNIFDFGWSMNIFRSVWFYGFPFLMIGFWIKKYEIILLNRFSKTILVLIATVGAFLTFIERLLIGNLQIYNGSILLVLALFLLAVKFPNTSSKNFFVILGAKYATEIYIYHWIIRELLIKARDSFGLYTWWFNWLQPFVAVLVTFFMVVFWHKVKGSLLRIIRRDEERIR